MKKVYSLCLTLLLGAFTLFAQEGKNVYVPNFDGIITIDGTDTEAAWENAVWQDINKVAETTSPLGFDFFAFEEPADANDFSGQFKIMYDTFGIYLFFDITDDIVQKAANIYDPSIKVVNDEYLGNFDGDRIEFYLKVGSLEVPAGGRNIEDAAIYGYYQFVVWPGDSLVRSSNAAPDSADYNSSYNWVTDKYEVAYQEKILGGQSGYTYEIFISKDILTDENGDPIDLKGANTFLFDVNVVDNDNSPYSAEPRSVISWSAGKNIHTVDPDSETWQDMGIGIATVGWSVGINDVYEKSPVTLYPNPVRNTLYMSKDVDNAKVYDLIGKEIMSVNVEGNQLDVSGLNNGMYIINLFNDNQNISVQKFQKIK